MAYELVDSVVLERRAVAKSAKLSGTLGQLRYNLTPARLTREATHEISHMSSAVAHALLVKAKSPIGLSAVGIGVAMAAAAYGLSQPPSRPRQADADAPVAAEPPWAEGTPQEASAKMSSSPPGGGVRSLLNLAAAVGVGIGLNRLIPVSNKEKQLLQGVGEEVEEAIHSWAREQATRLVHPPAGGSIGVVNILAMLIGVLGASRTRPLQH